MVSDLDFENGLNGRLVHTWPQRWDHEYAKLPDGEAVTVTDSKGKPWILVHIDKDSVCFVRLNFKYLVPADVAVPLGIGSECDN